jgi:hypothetical protein
MKIPTAPHISQRKRTDALSEATKEVGLKGNAKKTKYMLLSRHQNAGKNHNITTANSSFENVAQLKYLGTTVINQYFIQEEIKRRLNSDNACYHSVQNLLYSCLLPKKVKIKTYKIINLPVVLYGCETWYLTLKEKVRLNVFQKRMLRRKSGPKTEEIIGSCRNQTMRTFTTCILRLE